ncbi:hypothetical protein ORI20_02480 [Mycobacterium sp. CVI_P3]|uniref:CPBP family intramembrane metalloprotease n=1 Tax=Mycobacterium pinniadriaticum TaxID=2994102 RepID=A0ABT3S7R8_9MYCO|nr:hypothetical protein [Mycobacterium pinniadriaticum]MCX2929125.1 hypothetical protein [Mycobacterium pinniadriaticum]MCX2935550.1 hypothetical protein [Mycobacterium pinniadriaticum]
MDRTSYVLAAWIAAAAMVGFSVPALFVGVLRLRRSAYLVPYIISTSLFLIVFVRWNRLEPRELLAHNWMWGVGVGVLLAGFTVGNVLSQPVSPRRRGVPLALDVFWSGVVYGTVDALLLSVLPVLATWQAVGTAGWTTSWIGKGAVAVLALCASLVVTVAYHLGYPEYRHGGLLGPVVGNTAMTLGFVISGNPLAAVISHVAMHVAAVLRGPARVAQLPPHYPDAHRGRSC